MKGKEKIVEKQIQRITIIIPLSKMNPQQKELNAKIPPSCKGKHVTLEVLDGKVKLSRKNLRTRTKNFLILSPECWWFEFKNSRGFITF